MAWRNVPAWLTYARAGLTLVTYPVAYARLAPAFTVLVLLSVITDVLDGPIARRTRTANKHGANLDSAADFVFYASLPVWTFMFAPDIVRDLAGFIVAFFIAYVAANVISKYRRGVMGFHNRWTRLAGTIGVVFALTIILWGFNAPLFYTILGLLGLDLLQRYWKLIRPGGGPGGQGSDGLADE